MGDDDNALDWLRELNGEDEDDELPPGWEKRRDEDGYTCYYDSNRDIETAHPPPSKDWLPDKNHAHCACKNDPYCIGWDHHLPRRRPLAEPPMLDYDTYIENTLPSDIRFSKLFPNDVQRWTRARDHQTEHDALVEYGLWAYHMRDYESDPARRTFFEKLEEDINIDSSAVFQERHAAFEGAAELPLFEFHHLDQDGDTKGIQAWSEHDWDQVHSFSLQAWQKYGKWSPPGYEPKNRHWYCQWKEIDCSSKCPECPKPQRPERQSQPAAENDSSTRRSAPTEDQEVEELDQGTEVPCPDPAIVMSTEEDSGPNFHQQLFHSMYIWTLLLLVSFRRVLAALQHFFV